MFGVETISRTLNSLECVARGCSLQSAMLSPLFRVSDYEVQEYNALPVSISYQFGTDGKVVTKDLFPQGSTFPSTKSITFDNKKGGMDLLVHYVPGAPVIQGIPTQVAQYKIKEGTPKHDKYSFILRVSNNIHQIPCLEGVEIVEEWEEDEKIPVKKDAVPPPKKDVPADQQPSAEDQPMAAEDDKQPIPQQDFEIRKKKKKTTSALNYDTQAHALPPTTRKQFKDLENQLFHEDQVLLDIKAFRNALESYLYELKANIKEHGEYERYIDPSTKAKVLQEIEDGIAWIYGEGVSAQPDEYKT
ncbi:MAG: Hsp70 family protein, partial [Candidatus Roizmanbacteria bacterium]